jgi:hypothetical protein
MSREEDELLAKLVAATGPDRALDLAVAQKLVPDVIVGRQRDDDTGADPFTYWKYTGSIDDAAALVARLFPDATWWVAGVGCAGVNLSKTRRYHSDAAGPDRNYATPAIALLIALFLALRDDHTAEMERQSPGYLDRRAALSDRVRRVTLDRMVDASLHNRKG